MQNVDERVIPLMRSLSSVKNSTKITRSISKSDLADLNKRINKHIKEKEREKIINEEVSKFFLSK